MDTNRFSLLLFRNEVKTRYSAQPVVYHQLVQLLNSYNTNAIDLEQLKSSVETLLSDSDDLVDQFNSKITLLLPPDVRKTHMFSEKSRDFVHRVKERFEKQPEKYKLFISILRNVAHCSIKDTCSQVEMLFYDHPELLEEFEELVRVEFLNKEPSVKVASPQMKETLRTKVLVNNVSTRPVRGPEPVLLGTYLQSQLQQVRRRSGPPPPPPSEHHHRRNALSILFPARACGGCHTSKEPHSHGTIKRKRSTSLCTAAHGTDGWKKGQTPPPKQNADQSSEKKTTNATEATSEPKRKSKLKEMLKMIYRKPKAQEAKS